MEILVQEKRNLKTERSNSKSEDEVDSVRELPNGN
jgi:hypothetical protein